MHQLIQRHRHSTRWMVRADLAECVANEASSLDPWTEADFVFCLRSPGCIGHGGVSGVGGLVTVAAGGCCTRPGTGTGPRQPRRLARLGVTTVHLFNPRSVKLRGRVIG